MEARIDPEVDWREIILTVHNIGKTAAVMVEWVTLCEVLDELPTEPVYRDARKIRGRILRPDDPKGWEVVVFMTEADAVAVYHRQETVYLWGYFRYEDQFGQTRKSGFGYKGNPMGDEPGLYIGVLWSRDGGKAYNYDLTNRRRRRNRAEDAVVAPARGACWRLRHNTVHAPVHNRILGAVRCHPARARELRLPVCPAAPTWPPIGVQC